MAEKQNSTIGTLLAHLRQRLIPVAARGTVVAGAGGDSERAGAIQQSMREAVTRRVDRKATSAPVVKAHRLFVGGGLRTMATLHRIDVGDESDDGLEPNNGHYLAITLPDLDGQPTQSIRLRKPDLVALRTFMAGEAGEQLLAWLMSFEPGQEKQTPAALSTASAAGRLGSAAGGAGARTFEQVCSLSYEEVYELATASWDDASVLELVCRACRRNLTEWIRARRDDWRGPEVVENIEHRLQQLRGGQSAVRPESVISDSSEQSVLLQRLVRMKYETLRAWAKAHWDDSEKLAVAARAMRRNLPQWSAELPPEWRGRDAIEEIERRIHQLLPLQPRGDGHKPAVAPTVSTGAPQGTAARQPPGVPEWPSEAVEGAKEALAGDCFYYQQGVLSFLGYRVGQKSILTSVRRQRILDYVVLGDLPQVNDRHYMKQWGKPKSSTRLRKAAMSLAAFARNARRNKHADKSLAIAEWEEDLEYLKQRFFRHHRFDWVWPQTVRRERER